MAGEIITDYVKYLNAILDFAERCWRNRGGKFEVSVWEERDKLEASIKGGHNWQSKKLREEE